VNVKAGGTYSDHWALESDHQRKNMVLSCKMYSGNIYLNNVFMVTLCPNFCVKSLLPTKDTVIMDLRKKNLYFMENQVAFTLFRQLKLSSVNCVSLRGWVGGGVVTAVCVTVLLGARSHVMNSE
jgi:hypothetical protein